MNRTVVDSETKAATTNGLQVAPSNFPVPANVASLPTIAPETTTQLVVVDPELHRTQISLAKLRLWRGFVIENLAGVGFLATGLHDMVASSAFVSGIPAWEIVTVGLLALGLAPQLVEIIGSKFGVPKQ